MKTTTVEVEGRRYDLRKMRAATGGYIWQRLQAACLRAGQEQDQTKLEQAAESQALADALARPSEERMRGVCALAFMYLPYEDYDFIVNAVAKSVSRHDANGLPMPLMSDDGRWSAGTDDLQDNPCLVTLVMMESLVYNLHPYLAARTGAPTTATA
jgi:hypothetical protein